MRTTRLAWMMIVRATIVGGWMVGAMSLLFVGGIFLFIGDGSSPPFRAGEVVAIAGAALWFYSVFVAGLVRPWPRLLTVALFLLPVIIFAALWLQTREWVGPAIVVGMFLLPFALLRSILAWMFGD